MRLELPYPPTTNNLFINRGRKRIKSSEYRAWSELCTWQIKQQKPPKVVGPYAVDIVVKRPDRRKRDISNLIKALEDALVENGIVEDDSLCQELTIRWQDHEDCPLIHVYATKDVRLESAA